jgi:curved DNA-binding protein CbpA
LVFKDYYQILDVKIVANSTEIQKAFKKQAMKWHPDRNKGVDTTLKMQEILEARLVLLDIDARRRYDLEYRIFYNKKDSNKFKDQDSKTFNDRSNDYQFADEELKRWMSNAREQSVDLARQAIIDFRNIGKAGCFGIIIEGAAAFIVLMIASILFTIIGC